MRIQAPHQVVIPEGATSAEAAALLTAAGLQPPLLVKPLWTDGREGSHGLAVLHEMHTLDRLLSGQVSSDLQPPLVVQQFVEHGGVLFKVRVPCCDNMCHVYMCVGGGLLQSAPVLAGR